MANRRKTAPDDVLRANAVEWMGLCTCGCGSYKAVLVDADDKRIASFGWDAEGWLQFLAGVLDRIKEEADDGHVGHNHTAH